MTRIDTVDQLDALPIGSVIRDSRADVSERERSGWYDTGMVMPQPPILPAILLFVPGRDLVREAQANAWDEGYGLGVDDERSAAEADIGVGPNRNNPYGEEAP